MHACIYICSWVGSRSYVVFSLRALTCVWVFQRMHACMHACTHLKTGDFLLGGICLCMCVCMHICVCMICICGWDFWCGILGHHTTILEVRGTSWGGGGGGRNKSRGATGAKQKMKTGGLWKKWKFHQVKSPPFAFFTPPPPRPPDEARWKKDSKRVFWSIMGWGRICIFMKGHKLENLKMFGNRCKSIVRVGAENGLLVRLEVSTLIDSCDHVRNGIF